MHNKLGIGIVTYNRIDYFKKCLASVPAGEGTVVVVNDGDPYPNDTYGSKVKEVIQHTKNKSVGISKNEALRYLIQDGCDHLFLIEDDMEILRPDVFEAYIHAAEGSGIWHMNYGPGSPFNRVQTIQNPDLHNRHLLDQHSPPNPRLTFKCENGSEVALYQHTVAMFSYFLTTVIKAVGYHDERYHNAWEHVDLTYRIIKKGLHPPFWWFADIWDSTQYLREIEGAIQNSSIAKDDTQWKKNIHIGREVYRHTHGHYPNQIRDASEDEVKKTLMELETNYARPIL